MKRSIFLLQFCLFVSVVYSANIGKKIASIDEDDILEFRAKNYIEPVNEVIDLNPKSDDVIVILDKIKELEKKGFDMLNRVPDNEAKCSIQVKYYITAEINHAKEQCDYCIENNLDNDNRLELNVNQKNCALDILSSAKKDIEGMSETVESCRLIA